MGNWSDDEFLSYCHSMTSTDRCGVTPKQMARLCELSGRLEYAEEWRDLPNEVYDGYKNVVSIMVADARRKLLESKDFAG